MKAKLPIRRKSAILPTLCLVGLLVSIGLFLWLCHFGLPQVVIRQVEAAAAQQGITLCMDSLTLAPRSGFALRARNISIEIPQKNAAPLSIGTNRLVVGFELPKLLNGDYLPTLLTLRNAHIILPLTGEESLEAKNIDLRADLSKRRNLQVRLSGQIDRLFAELNIQLDPNQLPKNANTPAESAAPDIDAILENYRPQLLHICRETARQQWREEQRPRFLIHCNYLSELPRLRVIGIVPSYEYGNLHMRDIRMDIGYANNRITVRPTGFKTVNPDTEIKLSGSYQLNTRHANFSLKSTANLLIIARQFLGEEAARPISEQYISAPQPPQLQLEGELDLAENYNIDSITINGALHQKGLRIGQTESKALDLDFFYQDGNLNLSNCELEWADGGKLHISGILKDGRGKAGISLKTPAQSVVNLVHDLSSGFLQTPAELSLDGMLHAQVELHADAPVFEPGKVNFDNLIPTLRDISCSISLERASYAGTQAENPLVQVDCSGIDYNAEALSIRETTVTISAESLNAEVAGKALVGDISCTLRAADIRVPFDLNQAAPVIGELSGLLCCRELGCDDTRVRGLNLRLDRITDIVLDADDVRLPSSVESELELDELQHGEHIHVAELLMECKHGMAKDSNFLLKADVNGEPLLLSLSGMLFNDSSGALPHGLRLNQAEIELHPAAIKEFIKEMELSTDLILLPEKVMLSSTGGTINWDPFSLSDVEFRLEIPELVRTPQHTMLKGRDVPLGVDATVTLRTDETGQLLYDGTATLIHNPKEHKEGDSGEIRLTFSSPTPQSVRIQGSSTITADIADALIDDADAHSILRDFRFTPESRVTADDINALVDWSNGVNVRVTCKGDIRNTQLLLLGTEETKDAEGEVIAETLSKEWGADPLAHAKHVSCDVEVILQLDARGANSELLPDIQLVNLTHPMLCYDNRPWLKRQGIKGGSEESTVTGEGVYFDLEKNTLTLSELSGTCYPAYSFGMFYPDLMTYMSTVILNKPVDVSTHECVFPLSRNCEVPMSGTIRVTSKSGSAFRFLGTDIPLDDFSGFVTLTDTEVKLSRMNALSWGGVTNADVNIGISGGKTSIDGFVRANNFELDRIASAYNRQLSPAIVNADMRFRSPSMKVEDIQGYGHVQILDGNLEELNIFAPVSGLLSYITSHIDELIHKDKEYLQTAINNTVNSVIKRYESNSSYIPFLNHIALSYDIRHLTAPLYIGNGYLYTVDGKATGKNLKLTMNGNLNLSTMELDIDLGAAIAFLLPKLSKWRFNILVDGPFDNPQYRFRVRLTDPGKKQ